MRTANPVAATAATAALALLAGCAALPPEQRTATITRTAHGVAHIAAPDMRTLAYGVAYAHAQDNVCQTAQQLVTVRGERSRHFGAAATALLGRRMLPNEQIDFFVAAHMDDAALAQGPGELGALEELRPRRRLGQRGDETEGDAGVGRVGERVAAGDVAGPDAVVGLELQREELEGHHRVRVRAGARRRPEDGRAAPGHARHLPGAQAAGEELRAADGGGAGVGVRVLAVHHQAVGQAAHAGGDVGVQVEHAEDRDLGRARKGPQAGEQFALGVADRLGGHRTVQDEVDAVDARGEGGSGGALKLAPERLEGRVLHRGARHRARVHRRDHLPAVLLRHLEEAVGGRGVAPLREDRVAFHHRERLPRRHFIEEGMGLVEETAKENPRAHGRAWTGLRPEPSTWRRAARTPPRPGPAPHQCRRRCA